MTTLKSVVKFTMILGIIAVVSFCAHRLAIQSRIASELSIAWCTIDRQETTIDALETLCKFQIKDYDEVVSKFQARELELLGEIEQLRKDQKLLETAFKEYNIWSKATIKRLTSAMIIREQELLEEIEWLHECIRSGVLPPTSPVQTCPDGCTLPPLEVDEDGNVIRPKISPGFRDGEEYDGKDQETKARSRVVHPKRPCRLLKGKRVGC